MCRPWPAGDGCFRELPVPAPCPALRCHPGVTLSCVVWVRCQVWVLQDTTETNPGEQKRREIKFHIPRGATAQTRSMLGKKAQTGQVNPQVCPTPPSLDTPLLPVWGE